MTQHVEASCSAYFIQKLAHFAYIAKGVRKKHKKYVVKFSKNCTLNTVTS